MMEELVILDYSNSSVHLYKVDINADLNYYQIIILVFFPYIYSFMYAEDINIINHKVILK